METALVTPLLLVFVFGIIEVSMLVRDYVAVASAARNGARIAASAPAAGTCVPDALDDASACPPNAAPQFAQQAADAIARGGNALPRNAFKAILVYKANSAGYPGSRTSEPSSCAGISNCVTYTWRPSQNRFRWSSGSWDSRTVNACFPNNVDSVGVQVIADRALLTGMFGASITMSDHAVMNFEPLPTATCASGQHS